MYKRAVKITLLAINLLLITYFIFRKYEHSDLLMSTLQELIFVLFTSYFYLKIWKIFEVYPEFLIRISLMLFITLLTSFLSQMISALIFYLITEHSQIVHILSSSLQVGIFGTVMTVRIWIGMALFNLIVLMLVLNKKRCK